MIPGIIPGIRTTIGLALVIGLTVAATGLTEEKFGKGVTLTDATPIKALYASPEKFIGKTIRIDGVVTAVCQEMGCWMAIGETDKAEDTVRLKVEHEGTMVFPISAKGKPASAEGVFEKIAATDKDGKEAAMEHAAHLKNADFAKTYQIKATGAIVR